MNWYRVFLRGERNTSFHYLSRRCSRIHSPRAGFSFVVRKLELVMSFSRVEYFKCSAQYESVAFAYNSLLAHVFPIGNAVRPEPRKIFWKSNSSSRCGGQARFMSEKVYRKWKEYEILLCTRVKSRGARQNRICNHNR